MDKFTQQGKIFIEGLVLWVNIGVTPEERAGAQPVHLDLELQCDLSRAGETDAVADTIDYDVLIAMIKEHAAQSACALLERFGAVLIEKVQATFPLTSVRVRLVKPSVHPEAQAVGVELFSA